MNARSEKHCNYVPGNRRETEADTPHTLDYVRMAKVVDGVLNAVLHLSEAAQSSG